MSGVPRVALALVVLAVLAGCSTAGLGGPPTATPTATPAWPDPMPPGVTTSGVAEPLTLVRAHTAALVGRSFTYRETVTVSTLDGIRLGQIHTVHRVDEGTFVFSKRVDGVVPQRLSRVRHVDGYSNGTTTVTRYRIDGENRTLVGPAREATLSAYGVVQKGTLYSLVAATDPTVRGPLRRGGTTYVHLEGTNGTATIGVTRATNASFEALVAPSGLVHRYAFAYHANDSTYGGWEGRLVRTVVYDDVGATTVERPDWVDVALGRATEVPPGR